ncbi:flagellar hook-length control protein FliK [Anoxybacillus salavatliensis]|uniref:flagellar hook-length control protein FliK n=1 Tax=Anoxybacillus gonensis TaxID=198467 RepID=UPI00214B9632|nr:flagellar hook-length control protein FliK [Anoxybacillus gonensis]MCQ5363744.1 flagellar hook-length control protein FliK [Anoxybacillus gonensis]
MNIAPISSLTSFRGQQAQTTVQTNDGHAFAHLLSSLRQKSVPQPLPEQHMVQSIDWEALQQWLTQLPDDVTYADADMLSNEMIQSFLSLLPEEVKERMIDRFSTNQSFETMFTSENDRNEEDELALMMVLFQLEQKQQTIPEPMIEQVRTTMRTMFSMNDEQSSTLTAMLQNVIKEMNENDKRATATSHTLDDRTLENLLKDVPFTSSRLQEQPLAPKGVALLQGQQNEPRSVVSFNPGEQNEPLSAVSFNSGEQNEPRSAVSFNPGEQNEPRSVVSFNPGQQVVQKEFVSLSQERKQPIARMYEHMLHVGQQTTEHAPLEIKTIDTTKDTPFVTQFERILRTSKLTHWKNGNTQMLIRLHPEHLGYVTIKLIQQKGKLTAKMITSTDAAKQLVEQHIHQLAHIADHITVEKFHVFDEAKFRDHSFQQQKQQQHEKQKEEKKQHDESFDEWLKEWFDFE